MMIAQIMQKLFGPIGPATPNTAGPEGEVLVTQGDTFATTMEQDAAANGKDSITDVVAVDLTMPPQGLPILPNGFAGPMDAALPDELGPTGLVPGAGPLPVLSGGESDGAAPAAITISKVGASLGLPPENLGDPAQAEVDPQAPQPKSVAAHATAGPAVPSVTVETGAFVDPSMTNLPASVPQGAEMAANPTLSAKLQAQMGMPLGLIDNEDGFAPTAMPDAAIPASENSDTRPDTQAPAKAVGLTAWANAFAAPDTGAGDPLPPDLQRGAESAPPEQARAAALLASVVPDTANTQGRTQPSTVQGSAVARFLDQSLALKTGASPLQDDEATPPAAGLSGQSVAATPPVSAAAANWLAFERFLLEQRAAPNSGQMVDPLAADPLSHGAAHAGISAHSSPTSALGAPNGAPLAPPPTAQIVAQLLPQAVAAQNGPIEVLLNPAELGHLRFEIQHRGEGVQIVLSAERAETLDLLRRNGDQLLNDFRNAGFAGTSLAFGQWGGGQGRSSPQEAVAEAIAASDSVPAPRSAAVFAPVPQALDPSRALNLRV